MAMKFFGAEMEGVTQLENRVADPASYIPSRDNGRMFYNSTAQAIKFGAGGAFKSLDIPTGSVMLFGQSSAPAGWTKKTDWQNNSMLILTNDDISAGGDMDATSSMIISSGSHSHTVNAHTHTVTAETLSTSQIPSHTHTERGALFSYGSGGAIAYAVNNTGFGIVTGLSTASAGGGGSHSHGGVTGSTSPSTAVDGAHSHDITNPYYQTIIAATKD
jgi:hypothetical protein